MSHLTLDSTEKTSQIIRLKTFITLFINKTQCEKLGEKRIRELTKKNSKTVGNFSQYNQTVQTWQKHQQTVFLKNKTEKNSENSQKSSTSEAGKWKKNNNNIVYYCNTTYHSDNKNNNNLKNSSCKGVFDKSFNIN